VCYRWNSEPIRCSKISLGVRAKRSVEFGRRPTGPGEPNTPLFLPNILQSKPSSAGSSVKAAKLKLKPKSKSGRFSKGLKGGAKLALLYFTVEGAQWAIKKAISGSPSTTTTTPSPNLIDTLRDILAAEGGHTRQKRSVYEDSGDVVAQSISTIARLRNELTICQTKSIVTGAAECQAETAQWELDGQLSESEVGVLLAVGLTSTAVIVAVTYRFCLKSFLPNAS
jgi:hypothetical protein